MSFICVMTPSGAATHAAARGALNTLCGRQFTTIVGPGAVVCMRCEKALRRAGYPRVLSPDWDDVQSLLRSPAEVTAQDAVRDA